MTILRTIDDDSEDINVALTHDASDYKTQSRERPRQSIISGTIQTSLGLSACLYLFD